MYSDFIVASKLLLHQLTIEHKKLLFYTFIDLLAR
jgi:hypothetical protein